jgi:NRPS condensation-like uncharacterized protein
VYCHVVADAEAIIHLLRDIVETYNSGQPARSRPLEIHPPLHDQLHRQPPGLLARKLAALPGLVRAMRRSSRPPLANADDLTNGFALLRLSPLTLSTLVRTAKSWNVTLNDLFLALLFQSCDPDDAHLKSASRRRDISLGCIVNIRRDLPTASRDAFGLFLGSFIVSHRVPRDISLRELALAVRQQSLTVKRGKLYAGTPLEMLLARPLLARFSLERRKKIYHKNYPLWGGITNLNLNPLWPPNATTTAFDYFRAVSTGPVTPLVLSITTVGESVNVGISYRRNIHSAPTIGQVEAKFLSALTKLT